MSEKNRKALADLTAIIAEELGQWGELSESERLLFWRHYFELRDLTNAIERQFTGYDADGRPTR